eukprot:5351935-Ditylum_brightwellii.AAC.1
MVLKGEFNAKELDEVQKLFIQHCKLEPVDKVIGTKITKEQWKGKVAKWRGNTTTSPPGRHLGHFKTLIGKFAESPDRDKGQEMIWKREDIIDTHVSLLNYVAEQRYSCKRWQNIVNIVIAKLLGIDKD